MGYSFDRFLVFDYLLFLDDEMLNMTTQRIDKKTCQENLLHVVN
jgi:hypothetical protein